MLKLTGHQIKIYSWQSCHAGIPCLWAHKPEKTYIPWTSPSIWVKCPLVSDKSVRQEHIFKSWTEGSCRVESLAESGLPIFFDQVFMTLPWVFEERLAPHGTMDRQQVPNMHSSIYSCPPYCCVRWKRIRTRYRNQHTRVLPDFFSHVCDYCPHHGPHKCLIACKNLLERVGTKGCCEVISHVFRPWVGCAKVYQDRPQIAQENHAGSSPSFEVRIFADPLNENCLMYTVYDNLF